MSTDSTGPEWDSADSEEHQRRVDAGVIDQHGDPRQPGTDEWGHTTAGRAAEPGDWEEVPGFCPLTYGELRAEVAERRARIAGFGECDAEHGARPARYGSDEEPS